MAYTTIDNPELYFQTKLYTGNNGTQSITFDGSEDMQPDLIWNKARSATEEPNIWDSVRGTGKGLTVSHNYSDSSWSTGVTSFNSDGWTMGDLDSMNDGSVTYVAWCWKESATSGFDIVSYTGNDTARTISHSLSAVPKMMIMKNLADAASWVVYHGSNTSAPATDGLNLDTTGATDDDAGYFNDTDPTSSVFSVGTGNTTNGNSDAIIAYLFAEKQGFSKFGSYEGNNNADGTFVYTGFSVAWVMVKNIDTGSTKWVIQDSKRSSSSGGNPADARLKPNDNTAEEEDSDIDLLSNGFKIRSTGSWTSDADTFIYMAFAEAPLVNSNGVPCNAR